MTYLKSKVQSPVRVVTCVFVYLLFFNAIYK